jgi:hypothetical protein
MQTIFVIQSYPVRVEGYTFFPCPLLCHLVEILFEGVVERVEHLAIVIH